MKTLTKSSLLYETIFNKIIHGEYPANTKLREEKLAETHEVSRTPVREALRHLEKDGLVEMLTNRDTRVVGLTADDIEEVFQIRKVLECLALRFSIHTLSIAKLQQLRGEIIGMSASDDCREHAKMDSKLHSCISEASNKKRLVGILRHLLRLIPRFQQLSFRNAEVRAQATADHLALIDALLLRDLPKAEALLEQHIERSKLVAVALQMER
jgi:DNA-binding GntR family transcriptional regulator